MKMLYTANGRYIRCCTEEGTRPVIIVCEKEYEVDVQEFMLWSILNWRILREEEIGSYYEKMANNTSVTIHRSWQDCVQRLLVRGLIVAGTGDTEYDALYDLLACRFIVPIGAAWPLRVLSFLKLTFWRASHGKSLAACSMWMPAVPARKRSFALPGRLPSPARKLLRVLRWTSVA